MLQFAHYPLRVKNTEVPYIINETPHSSFSVSNYEGCVTAYRGKHEKYLPLQNRNVTALQQNINTYEKAGEIYRKGQWYLMPVAT